MYAAHVWRSAVTYLVSRSLLWDPECQRVLAARGHPWPPYFLLGRVTLSRPAPHLDLAFPALLRGQSLRMVPGDMMRGYGCRTPEWLRTV